MALGRRKDRDDSTGTARPDRHRDRPKSKPTERAKLDATPPWETRVREEPAGTTGPYDERDAPVDEVQRIDLGALLVPVVPDIDLRLEVDENQQVVAVTIGSPDGTLQLGVFAAPRNEGIWDEVRAEIADSIAQARGSVKDDPDGEFGTELVGQLQADGGLLPVRFLGVDGPRWFLRGMLVGPAAEDRARSEPLVALMRDTIVVRGKEPLPVRDPVPLRLPKDIAIAGQPGDESPAS